jgi:hypothetical protein
MKALATSTINTSFLEATHMLDIHPCGEEGSSYHVGHILGFKRHH